MGGALCTACSRKCSALVVLGMRLQPQLEGSTARGASSPAKPSLTHTTAVVDDERGHFFFGHVCTNQQKMWAVCALLGVACCETDKSHSVHHGMDLCDASVIRNVSCAVMVC